MRLYPFSNDTVKIADPEYGTFEIKDHGGFDLPDELSDRLGKVCVRGRRQWESEEERSQRMHASEAERRRDPQTLYEAVAELVGLARDVRSSRTPADDDMPAVKAPARKAAAKPPAKAADDGTAGE